MFPPFAVAYWMPWCHARRQIWRKPREELRQMAKRKSINYPGFKHENPIPNASRIGNILKQIKLCVEAAGGTVDDIIKVNFWMKDPATGRKALNGKWSAMFPDPESRPARHTLALPANAANHVTCDFTAVIGN